MTWVTTGNAKVTAISSGGQMSPPPSSSSYSSSRLEKRRADRSYPFASADVDSLSISVRWVFETIGAANDTFERRGRFGMALVDTLILCGFVFIVSYWIYVLTGGWTIRRSLNGARVMKSMNHQTWSWMDVEAGTNAKQGSPSLDANRRYVRTYSYVLFCDAMIHVETPSQTHFSFLLHLLLCRRRYETLCRRKSLIVQRHRRPHSILFKHVLLTSSRIRLQARAMRSF